MSEKPEKVYQRRLCQVVGTDSTLRTQTKTTLMELHRVSAREELFTGFDRSYTPFTEEDKDLPETKSKKVQKTSTAIFAQLRVILTPLYDVTFTKDSGNGVVKADVTIDGVVIAKDVHVPTLLWLKDRLDDLHKFVVELPVLDPAETWVFDENAGYYKTGDVETVRKVKQDKVIQLAKATEQHPEQAQIVKEDIPVGTFTKVLKSGALHGKTKRAILARIEALRLAVIEAREGANSTKVDEKKLGNAVFDYILQPLEAT